MVQLVAVAGCGSSHAPGTDGFADGGGAADGLTADASVCRDDIDVVLVVHDRAGSGFWLTNQIEFIANELETLASRGHSVRVTMLSGDLGAGGHEVSGCREAGDGAMPLVADGCSEPVVQVEAGNPDRTVDQLLCRLDGDPCAFFRPLDALASYEMPPMTRPDSRVLLTILAPLDDCSATSDELYDLDSEAFEGRTLDRCVLNPEALQVIEDVRASMTDWTPGRLAVFMRGGIPAELSGMPASTILSDSDFQQFSTNGEDVCEGRMGSVPMQAARRLVEFASSLESDGALLRLQSGCLPLTRADDGSVADWLSCAE